MSAPALLYGLAQPLTPAEEYAACRGTAEGKRIQRTILAGITDGKISPAEIWEALCIPRQTIYRWSQKAGIDVERARKQYVQRLVKAAMEAQ